MRPLIIFFCLFATAATAQIHVTAPGKATIQYDTLQGIASLIFPLEEYPFEFPAHISERIVLADGSEQACITTDNNTDGVPLFWVYVIRGYAEIHIPSLGAVYTTGEAADALIAPKPRCYAHLLDAKL